MEAASIEFFTAEMPNKTDPSLTDIVTAMFVVSSKGELISFEVVSVLRGVKVVHDSILTVLSSPSPKKKFNLTRKDHLVIAA